MKDRLCVVRITDPLPLEPFQTRELKSKIKLVVGRPTLKNLEATEDYWVTRHAYKPDRIVVEAAKARGLKKIFQAASGHDNWDLKSLETEGIAFQCFPGLNATTAAEHTWSLILALRKNLPRKLTELEAGRWNRDPVSLECAGRKLCVLGLGHVGLRVAALGIAFGMEVRGFDPAYSPARAPANLRKRFPYHRMHGWKGLSTVQRRLLKQLKIVKSRGLAMKQADILTLHYPPGNRISGRISHKDLALLAPQALVINAARAEILDLEAVWSALRAEKLGGLAIDVFEREPLDTQNFLGFTDSFIRSRVLATAHLGGVSLEAQTRLAQAIAHEISKCLRSRNATKTSHKSLERK